MCEFSVRVLRQLPTSINKRILTLSSDKQTFEDAAPAYQNALDHSNFSHDKLEYTPHETQRPRRNRQRNVIWFNPPFSKNVQTNIARSFHLVDTHFPAGHQLHKIFNWNTVKVSYSCMNNVIGQSSHVTTRV